MNHLKRLMQFLKQTSLGGKRTLFLPLFSLIGIILALFILLSVSTYRHFHQGRIRMEESLRRDGQIILKSLEVSFHTGMMGMMGRTDDLQTIMNSITTIADIHFIALMDREGRILAHNGDRLVGTVFPQKEKIRELVGREESLSWFGKEGEFLIAKKMDPLTISGMRGGMGKSMWLRMRSMMGFQETFLDKILSGEVYAVAGLGTKGYEEARRNDLRHALMMGVILLILGTAGFYFIFLVQNYYVTQKALDSLTTYANRVVENMPSGLLSIDPGGNIITLNNKAGELLAIKGAYPDREAVKEKLRPFLEPIQIALREKSPILEKEVAYPTQEGKSVPLSLSASRLILETGEDLGMIVILRDLREIKELQEKIQRSERLAGLGTLAAGMAHEIRNPLSSIKGFAQYFLKKNPPASEERKYSQVIIDEVERLNRVITSLLDFARPKEPVKTPLSMEDIIHHSLELIGDQARTKGVVLKTEIEGDLPLVRMDGDQITQVILNIILNGLESLTQGGTLSISARINKEKKNLIVEVADDGPGMAEEDLSKIFDPFYTTKKTGTGLGLAIAYRIMEKHHGTLTVKSLPGSGSVFRIALPLPEEEKIG